MQSFEDRWPPDFDIRQQERADSARARETSREPRLVDRDFVLQRKARLEKYVADANSPLLRYAVNSFGLLKSLSNPVQPLSAPSQAAPDSIARNFLRVHQDLFLLEEDDIRSLKLVSRDAANGGLTILRFTQTVNGIDVYGGQMTLALNEAGQVVQASAGDVVPGLRIADRPILTEREAVRAAFGFLDLDAPSELPALACSPTRYSCFRHPAGEGHMPIRTRLTLFPLTVSTARPAYRVFLQAGTMQFYEILVDARDSRLLARHNLASFTGKARVWKKSPIAGAREMVSFPAGWIPSDGTVTTGNNVDAFLDRNVDRHPDSEAPLDLPDIEGARASSASQIFDFPAAEGSTGTDPRDYPAAAVTNLFYLINAAHDYFYNLGFTEQAGNFQTDNFGRGGEENDAIRAHSQGDFQNAFFMTPPDGIPGEMVMGIFRGEKYYEKSDDLDASYSAQIVFHEYAHGVTNRIVGGPYNLCLSGIQSRSLGEGWSDYFAVSYTDDPVNGAYLTGDNESGIRRYSYENYPHTYEDLGNTGSYHSVHPNGEIWAAALWDLRKELGPDRTNKLVMDGLKLTPCNPTMIDARDAIFTALDSDAANNTADRAAAWRVFARYGMGHSAGGFEGIHHSTIHNAAFDLPPDLQPGNRNPIIRSRPPSFRPTRGKDFVYPVQAVDPDSEELSYELTAGPAGMTVDPSGTVRWTTAFTRQRVKIAVTDAAGGVVVHGFPLFPKTILQPGRPVVINGEERSRGESYMEVPPDTPVLQVTLRNGSGGNPNLQVYSPLNYYGGSFDSGINETLSVPAPVAGNWNFDVYNASNGSKFSGVSLEASFPVPILIGADIELTNISGEKTSETFYHVAVPNGASSFTVSTAGGEGDVDLVVRKGEIAVCPKRYVRQPNERYCVFSSISAEDGNSESVRINNPEAGDWFIDLVGYDAYSLVTLRTSTIGLTAQPWQPPLCEVAMKLRPGERCLFAPPGTRRQASKAFWCVVPAA